MEKIKIAVLGPTGDVVNEMEMDWPADQLDRFICGSRVVVFSNEEPVFLAPIEPRWAPPITEKDG